MNYSISLKALLTKELSRVLRIWKQTILPAVITSILYFLIFWKFIGSQIDSISGVPYITFIVPGFIMMSMLTASYANVSSSFFGAKFQRSIEEILVAPIPNWMIIVAYCLGWILRGLIIWVLIYIVAHFFTDVGIDSIFITFLFGFFSSSLFALLGLFNWFFAKSFDDVNIIPTFVITPLVYLGWVFYSLEFLSPFWQFISQFNPIFYMVNGFRYGMLWFSELSVYTALIAIIVFNIVFFAINLKLLNKGYGLKS